MNPLAVFPMFLVTAVAEILGCYLVFLWMRGDRSSALLIGAAFALGVFAWLLSFHPSAGRAYAAYGGVYVASAVVWGWLVEKQPPDRWDLIGAAVSLVGMAIITFGPRSS
jgi:small multidrug resistance family-3 protein